MKRIKSCRKMSVSSTGIKKSEKEKRQISETLTGRSLTDIHKDRIRSAIKSWYDNRRNKR